MPKAVSLSPPMTQSVNGGWLTISQSPYWFQSDTKAPVETILSHPTVYACVSLIANDIGKLRTRLMAVDSSSIWAETTNPAFSPVLKRANRYQNQIQFKQSWIMSKLLAGNMYALKQRDGRGVVVGLYILDPLCTVPLVAPDGSVFYQLQPDNLTGLEQNTIVVPASEIIHDRMNCLFHPLVGVSPLYAASLSAEQGLQIQKDSKRFFTQGAKPSGILAAPGQISQQTADDLKAYWNENFTGENAGRVAVVGDGLKYEPIRMTAVDAQTSEQVKLSSEFIAQAFHVPLFKLGMGTLPAGQKVGDMNLIYYSDCLQSLIEEMEACLDDGLSLPAGLRTELELSNLLRMDPATQADILSKLVGGAIMKPNEGRQQVNLPPVTGGDAVYLQQQNYSLEALAERDKTNPLAAPPAPAPAPAPEPPPADPEEVDGEEVRALLEHIMKGLACGTT
ncbi:MAG: phage portal protein [Proteobacteria bacterium]|nr:phage portal protein [Pseudomonadota bacterium]